MRIVPGAPSLITQQALDTVTGATAAAATAAAPAAAPAAKPDSGFDAMKKKLMSVSGRFATGGAAPLPVRQDLLSVIAGQRSVAQAGGTVTSGTGLDVSGYTKPQLKKLDVVADGKLDANELNGAVAFADTDFDGRISKKEQKALDYIVGKDTTIAAAKAFVELHGDGRMDDVVAGASLDVMNAEKVFDQKDKAHDTLVYEATKQEADMRTYMSSVGVDWSNDAPKQIKEQIAALGKNPDPAKLEKLELQLVYSEMHAANAAEMQTSYDGKMAAKKVRDDARIEHKAIGALAAEGSPRLEGAMQTVARHETQAVITDMIALRGEVENSPKVRDAFVKNMKAEAIRNAARDGKLDIDEVDMDAVTADMKSSRKIINDHSRRMEEGATKIAKNLEDPKFLARIDQLPDDERTQILTDMHSLIADTEAGREFFNNNILPGLKGKDVKRPEIYDQLKLNRHGSKLGLNLLGVWGARIANAGGGKEAMQLMDAGLARAIGVRADQMPKIYQALELQAGTALDGLTEQAREKAARDFLAKDPELKAIGGRLNTIAGGIAFASATLAAVDLVKNPSVRTALGAAKSASEIAEVVNRMAKVTPGVARYARFAGRLGPPLDVLIGSLDGYKAAKRNDVAGAIGGFTQAAGGIAGTAGVIAAAAGATGVGLPLAVVGGAIAVLGSLVSTIWGDSPTEQWLKDNAPEYIK